MQGGRGQYCSNMKQAWTAQQAGWSLSLPTFTPHRSLFTYHCCYVNIAPASFAAISNGFYYVFGFFGTIFYTFVFHLPGISRELWLFTIVYSVLTRYFSLDSFFLCVVREFWVPWYTQGGVGDSLPHLPCTHHIKCTSYRLSMLQSNCERLILAVSALENSETKYSCI